MPNEYEKEEVVNTETYENDSEGESVVEETEVTPDTSNTSDTSDTSDTTPKQSKEERERGILARLLKKYGEDKSKESKADTPKGLEMLQERLDRQELRLAGITDKEEMKEVLSLARKLELDIEDAVSHPAVKAVLKDMRNKRATPPPSTRTSSGARDEVEYWASKDTLAPTPELRKKVREYLASKK